MCYKPWIVVYSTFRGSAFLSNCLKIIYDKKFDIFKICYNLINDITLQVYYDYDSVGTIIALPPPPLCLYLFSCTDVLR